MRYSPLKKINTKNVASLKVAWTYDTQVAAPPPATNVPSNEANRTNAPAIDSPEGAAAPGRGGRGGRGGALGRCARRAGHAGTHRVIVSGTARMGAAYGRDPRRSGGREPRQPARMRPDFVTLHA